MRVQRVLIESGQTPTGFGLALLRELGPEGAKWYMRPLSPCCGEFVQPHDEYKCDGCTRTYQIFAEDCRGTIGNPVPMHDEGIGTDDTFSRWVARIMGFPNAEGKHNVEVSITWT